VAATTQDMKSYQSILTSGSADNGGTNRFRAESEVESLLPSTHDRQSDTISATHHTRSRKIDLVLGFVIGVLCASVAAVFGVDLKPRVEIATVNGSSKLLVNKNNEVTVTTLTEEAPQAIKVSLGPRPFFLVDQLSRDHPLKEPLQKCAHDIVTYQATEFVIGHRGASLEFPEHTFRSHTAASRMGAGIVECDVTFTKDRQLVCRHSQCDLHRTTDVLLRPEMASKCRTPFVPAYHDSQGTRHKATVKCCTTDFTLEEIQSLCGTMDAANVYATSPASYVAARPGLPDFRTNLYSHDCPRIPSHKEYIANVYLHGSNFTPELKVPDAGTPMPFGDDGAYTREAYATQMIREYVDLGIPHERVHPQAFDWNDLFFWTMHFPDYARNGYALDSLKNETVLSSREELQKHFQPLVDYGIKTVAPAIWMLITTAPSPNNASIPIIVPSLYAKVAKEDMGLDIVAWTLERSDSLALSPGFYYQSVTDAITSDSDIFTVLNVLAQQVKIRGIFSDFASTATFYANCFGL
jgi:glycerophosphoryl diester phosphodiesterase